MIKSYQYTCNLEWNSNRSMLCGGCGCGLHSTVLFSYPHAGFPYHPHQKMSYKKCDENVGTRPYFCRVLLFCGSIVEFNYFAGIGNPMIFVLIYKSKY